MMRANLAALALTGAALLAGACSDAPEARSPAPATDPPAEADAGIAEPVLPPAEEPPVLVVEAPDDGVAAGRLALLEARLEGGTGSLSTLEAKLGGRDVVVARFDEDGRRYRLLAPVDIDETRQELSLTLEGQLAGGDELRASRRLPVKQVEYPTSEIRVSKRFMQPSRKQRRRAKREKKRIQKVLKQRTPGRLWWGSFARPVDTRETSPFGTARLLNGKKKSRHLGWDLDGNTGDPIRAAARGRAVLVRDHFYSGRTVVLDHGQQLFTLYFHMSAFDVREGQMVEQGQVIGRVGKTGRVTGPHLHLSVKVSGLYVDPKHVLALDLDDDPLVARAAGREPPGDALNP
jgi:murein DD-endopeptidase MepM/ murein hydrolase activator NlpD